MVGWKVSVREMTVVILKIVSQATTTAVKTSLKKVNLPHFKMLSRLFGAAKFAEFVKCRRFLLEVNS